MSGFRIAYFHQTNIGQFLYTSVIDLNSRNIMFPISNSQCITEVILCYKITHNKCSATFFQYMSQILDSHFYISLLAFWLEVYQFSDNIKNMFTSFLRRYKFLNLIREKYHTNLIIVLNS